LQLSFAENISIKQLLALKNQATGQTPSFKYGDDFVGRSETYFLAGKSKESLADAEQALKRYPRDVAGRPEPMRT
jgi:hypothetical protein